MWTSLLEAARSVYTVLFNGENEYKARLRAHTLSFMSFSLLIVLVLLLPSAFLVERGEEGAMALRLMMLAMAGSVVFLLLDRRQLRDPRWALLWILVSGSLLPVVFWYDAALGAIVLPMGLLVARLVLGRALAWPMAILVCAAVLSAAWMRGLLPDNTKITSLIANSLLAMALMGVLMTIPARSSWQQRATKMFYAFAVMQTAKLIALTGLFALLEQPLWTLKDEPFYVLLAGLAGWLAQRGYRQSVWLIGLLIACSFSYHLVDEIHKQGVFSSSALLLFVVIATLGLPAVHGRWFARIISLCVASIMIWQAEAETAAYFIVMLFSIHSSWQLSYMAMEHGQLVNDAKYQATSLQRDEALAWLWDFSRVALLTLVLLAVVFVAVRYQQLANLTMLPLTANEGAMRFNAVAWLGETGWLWLSIGVFVAFYLAWQLATISLNGRRLQRVVVVEQSLQAQAKKALLEAETARQAKTAFLSNMSHEMRTPLNGLYGLLQVFAMKEVTAQEAENYLNAMADSVKRLSFLIEDLLDVGHLSSGDVVLNNERFSLSDVINNIVTRQQPVAAKKGLALMWHAPSEDYYFVGDRHRVGQIVENLIGNALKFTDRGVINVTLSQEHKTWCVAVTDTGIGIAKHELPRIFKRFEQGDSGVTKRYQGAGLGLSISRQMAHMMGGDIEVNSVLGEGSCFTLCLPMPDNARHPTALSDEQPLITQPLKASGAVLFVDDDASNRQIMGSLLDMQGWHVSLADSAEAALRQLALQAFDVVVTDIAMPEMSGEDLLQSMRARGMTQPVIAMTGNGQPQDLVRYQALGFDEVLIKPVAMEMLESALIRHLP